MSAVPTTASPAPSRCGMCTYFDGQPGLKPGHGYCHASPPQCGIALDAQEGVISPLYTPHALWPVVPNDNLKVCTAYKKGT